jgi:hypothetical protein
VDEPIWVTRMILNTSAACGADATLPPCRSPARHVGCNAPLGSSAPAPASGRPKLYRELLPEGFGVSFER